MSTTPPARPPSSRCWRCRRGPGAAGLPRSSLGGHRGGLRACSLLSSARKCTSEPENYQARSLAVQCNLVTRLPQSFSHLLPPHTCQIADEGAVTTASFAERVLPKVGPPARLPACCYRRGAAVTLPRRQGAAAPPWPACLQPLLQQLSSLGSAASLLHHRADHAVL